MAKNKSIIRNYSREEMQKLLDTSNSYSDILRKIGLNPKGGNPATLKEVIKEYNLDEDQLNKNRSQLYSDLGHKSANSRQRSSEEFFSYSDIFIDGTRLRERLLKEELKEYKCERCGISEWNGQPIVLQVHHKDGNRYNNKLTNLVLLCPNCHSQTDTFAGKNVHHPNGIEQKSKPESKSKSKSQLSSKRPTREELKELIYSLPFTKIGEKFGVSDNAVRKWCKFYGLPHRKKDIKTTNK